MQLTKARDTEIDIFKLVDVIGRMMPAAMKDAGTVFSVDEGKITIDLDISDQIAGFLSTVFTTLRKIENGGASARTYRDFKVTFGTSEITVNDVLEQCKDIKLDFMIATPLMNLLTGFKLFFDEVRTGVTKFTIREDLARKGIKRKAGGAPVKEAEDRKMNITAYGLTNQHIPLLQGITLPPERRTGLMRSLGPLTQAILLVNENQFPDKLCSALKNSLAMLPMHAEIATCLRDAKT